MAKKILIVDDNPNVLKLLNISLSKAGYTMVEAENGEVAFQMANKEKPDLIISDIMMPQMDGIYAG
jgi:two-component system alkaline phosphatase synthesis response regulator PhoP